MVCGATPAAGAGGDACTSECWAGAIALGAGLARPSWTVADRWPRPSLVVARSWVPVQTGGCDVAGPPAGAHPVSWTRWARPSQSPPDAAASAVTSTVARMGVVSAVWRLTARLRLPRPRLDAAAGSMTWTRTVDTLPRVADPVPAWVSWIGAPGTVIFPCAGRVTVASAARVGARAGRTPATLGMCRVPRGLGWMLASGTAVSW